MYRRQFSPSCPFLSHTFLAIIIVIIILFIATLTWFFEGSGREDESKTWRKLGGSWKAAAGQGLGDYDDNADDGDYDDDDNDDDSDYEEDDDDDSDDDNGDCDYDDDDGNSVFNSIHITHNKYENRVQI